MPDMLGVLGAAAEVARLWSEKTGRDVVIGSDAVDPAEDLLGVLWPIQFDPENPRPGATSRHSSPQDGLTVQLDHAIWCCVDVVTGDNTPAAVLDVGGRAQGYAVDLAVALAASGGLGGRAIAAYVGDEQLTWCYVADDGSAHAAVAFVAHVVEALRT